MLTKTLKISEEEERVNTRNAQVDEDLDEGPVENDQFFIDTIVSHKINRNKRHADAKDGDCLLYTSPSPRDQRGSRMPSSA